MLLERGEDFRPGELGVIDTMTKRESSSPLWLGAVLALGIVIGAALDSSLATAATLTRASPPMASLVLRADSSTIEVPRADLVHLLAMLPTPELATTVAAAAESDAALVSVPATMLDELTLRTLTLAGKNSDVSTADSAMKVQVSMCMRWWTWSFCITQVSEAVGTVGSPCRWENDSCQDPPLPV